MEVLTRVRKINYFEGKFTKDEAVNMIKQNSRRFAKRQLTWFGKDKEITWFHPDDKEKIMEFIHNIRFPLNP